MIASPDIATATRNSNTAFNSQPHVDHLMVPKVDWLSMSFEGVNFANLEEYLQQRLDFYLDYDSRSILGERNEVWVYFQSCDGGSVGVRSYGHSLTADVRLCITGATCERYSGLWLQQTAIELVEKFRGHCTRIDVAADDYSRALDFDEVLQAIGDRHIAGFSCSKYVRSYGGSEAGKTIYLGTRRSYKYGRIYDRYSVTKGEQNCIRYEVEYKREGAKGVFLDYIKCQTVKELHEKLASILAGSFDFVIKKDKNLTRATRLEWWQKFIDRLSHNVERINYPKKIKSVQKTAAWIKKSVSKSLLILSRALSLEDYGQTINLWINEAAERLSGIDRLNIDIALREGLCYADIA